MNDFHAFDNAVMARVTRLISTVAIIPLAALLMTSCAMVPGSEAEAAYLAKQADEKKKADAANYALDQQQAAYELERCAGWLNDEPAYAYSQKWKVHADKLVADTGWSQELKLRMDVGDCALWINTLRTKGTF